MERRRAARGLELRARLAALSDRNLRLVALVLLGFPHLLVAALLRVSQARVSQVLGRFLGKPRRRRRRPAHCSPVPPAP